MDSERVILVAGITAVAAVVGTFILWGPSTAIRPRKRGKASSYLLLSVEMCTNSIGKYVCDSVLGTVIGLQNLGLTCYLNSLLQAMASCHYFVEWLNLQENKGEVATAMRKLLNSK